MSRANRESDLVLVFVDREIKLLQELHHHHVIALRDVFGGVKSNISLVMDFMDTDLEIVIKDTTIVLTPANIKSYILQTLKGRSSNPRISPRS